VTSPRAWLDGHVNLEATAGKVEALSLDRMRSLVSVLGDPQAAYPVIHLTGTNGKGSTARMVEAVLRAHGLSVGLYTSPDLEGVEERLVWDGRPIEPDDLDTLLRDLAAVEDLVDGTPSRFELLTAGAFRWFADLAVDVAVVEVGLLGRYDATNVADGTVAVVTNVGHDHTDGGPGWRRQVAGEKAGILKPGATLVLGETDPDLYPVFEEEGAERIWRRGRDFDAERNRAAVGGRLVDVRTPLSALEDLYLPVHGAHQGENLAVALTAAEAFFDRALDEDVVGEALGGLALPGRFEIVSREPLLVLDGAHNVDGVAALAATLRDDFPPVPTTVVVLGMLGGRDPAEMVAALDLGAHDVVLCTTAPSPRALPAAEVAAVVEAAGLEVEVEPAVVEALGRARALATPEDRIVVTGSLYVVGAARAALHR
jgi:dihydrofolate synthase / folylpolyglutamate synthase